jgi:CheY-like chemotaxis protein
VLIISNLDERPRGLALGAAGYLVKPVSRQQFYSTLTNILASERVPPSKALVMLPEAAEAPPGPLVLLAEDNEDSSLMLSEYLRNKGYRALIARNGMEAIEQAREVSPALIVMDIQMPGMDGLEAIRRIRADAELQHIPIIALTALAMPGDRERCLQAGANEYLSKPVSLKKLLQMVHAFCSGC